MNDIVLSIDPFLARKIEVVTIERNSSFTDAPLYRRLHPERASFWYDSPVNASQWRPNERGQPRGDALLSRARDALEDERAAVVGGVHGGA